MQHYISHKQKLSSGKKMCCFFLLKSITFFDKLIFYCWLEDSALYLYALAEQSTECLADGPVLPTEDNTNIV